jgi:hypothetical protein
LRARKRLVGEIAEDVPADAARSASVFTHIEDDGVGLADFGELRGELLRAGVVAEGAQRHVGDVAGKEFVFEGSEGLVRKFVGFGAGGAAQRAREGLAGGIAQREFHGLIERPAEEGVFESFDVEVLRSGGAAVGSDALGAVLLHGDAVDGDDFDAAYDAVRGERRIAHIGDEHAAFHQRGVDQRPAKFRAELARIADVGVAVLKPGSEFGQQLVILHRALRGAHLGKVGEVEAVPIDPFEAEEVNEVKLDFGPDAGKTGDLLIFGEILAERRAQRGAVEQQPGWTLPGVEFGEQGLISRILAEWFEVAVLADTPPVAMASRSVSMALSLSPANEYSQARL